MFESRAFALFARLSILAAALITSDLRAGPPTGVLAWDPPSSASANSYTLRLHGFDLELSDDVTGALLARKRLARTTGVVINGTDGAVNDTLTIDFIGGVFVLPNGIRYDGGRGGIDALVAKNGFVKSGSHHIINDHSGILMLGDLAVVYSNLEPITDTASGSLTVSGTDGADTITIDNGTANGDGLLRVTVNASEPIEFSNKTQLTVDAGLTAADVGDNIIINFTEVATGLTFIQVNGGAGTDSITVQATAAGPVTQLNGGDGNDVFNVGSPVNSLDAILGSVFNNGDAGSDVLNVNDQADADLNTYTVGGAITRTGAVTINYTTQETIQVNGGTNNNTFNVTSAPTAALSIAAGGGNNTVAFSNNMTLNGGTIDGVAGTDLLDYSAYTPGVVVNLGANAPSFVASLDGGQENPPNSTSESGTATLTYNPATKTFDITLAVVGIAPADVTGFHIHLAPYGVNGPIHVDFAPGGVPIAPLVPGGGGFTFSASGVPLPPADEAAFLGGIMYLNIHTPSRPGGLIRGQIFAGALFVAAAGTATGTNGISGIENVNGGSGPDSLVGDLSTNTLDGNQGSDTIVGVRGNDILNGDTANDTITWSNGDGTDVVDGGAGNDTVQVNGALGANDVFTVAAGPGGRVDFDCLSPGPFSLDIGTVETLRVVGVSGDDTFTVGDLTGVVDLTSVQLLGDSGNDTFNVTPAPTQTMNVDGGIPIPPASPGDTLTVVLAGTTNPALLATNTPNGLEGTYTFGNRALVNFAEIETLPTTSDLAITKTDSPDPVLAGQTIAYTITLTNPGAVGARFTDVRDGIPVGTTVMNWAQSSGPPADSVGFDLGTQTYLALWDMFPAGATATIDYVVQVNSNVAAGTIVTNTATVTATSLESSTANNSATASTTVATLADLATSKIDSPDPVAAGNNITYTFTVATGGPSDAQNITVTDAVPANTTFVSFTAPAGWTPSTPAVGGTGTVTATTPTFAVGTPTAVFTLVVRVNAATPGGTVITNSAIVSSTTTDPLPINNTATETTTVGASADLSVTKTDTPDPVVAAGNITYTITVTNNGTSDAQGVTLSDVVPANTTFVSLTAPAGWTPTTPPVGGTGTVTATNPTLAAAATATFSLVVQVNAATANGSTITNTATVTSTTADPVAGNNSATTTTTVNNAADLAVTKTDTPDPANAGGNITYTLTVTNNGPLTAQNVSLSDVVPANTTFVSMTAPAGWTVTTPPVGGTGTVTATNPALAAAAPATFTLVVQVNASTPSATTITNTATVSTTTPDVVVGNNTATSTTTVGGPAGNIPALSPLLLAMLAAMLGGLAFLKLKS